MIHSVRYDAAAPDKEKLMKLTRSHNQQPPALRKESVRKNPLPALIATLTLAALVGALILGVVGQAFAATGYMQNQSGEIAYVSGAGQSEIWLIAPDGSNNRRLWSPAGLEPGMIDVITGLSWRPDSGMLAFASAHEQFCSWYRSDLYTLLSDGSGLRRVTNAPTCAGLAAFPKGTVTVTVENATLNSGVFGVYVAGAPGVQTIALGPFGSAQLTFTDVADLGDTMQPATAIYGGYRWIGGAVANVQAGQTVDAGVLTLSGEGFWQMGVYKSSWTHDGAYIGYTTKSCTPMHFIPPAALPGRIGEPILNTVDVSPCVMAWGPTPATANQVLYAATDYLDEDTGIFLVSQGSASPGTRLVEMDSFEGEFVYDLAWLPDGSGFIYSMQHVDFGIMSDIFEYNFSTGMSTQLTSFEDEQYAIHLTVSPDGQQIVFELAGEFGGPTDLYIMDRDGTDMRLLIAGGSSPAWSPGPLQIPSFTHLFIPLVIR
jgi:hypothetical protein